jgi:hypothetical protein
MRRNGVKRLAFGMSRWFVDWILREEGMIIQCFGFGADRMREVSLQFA